jgi:uncharacterized protein YdaU (DUF1376 family)
MPDTLPYLRLHPRDFFSDPDFIAMTNEQAGAYIRLFCMAWLSDPPGTLPNDDERLAALCQANAMAWGGIKAAVMAPFRLIDGRWHHPLQRREYESATQFRERQSDNAKRGWEARKGSHRTATAMPPHTSGNAKPMPPSPSPSPSKERARAFTALGEERPANCDDATWDGVCRAHATEKARRDRNAEAARQNGFHA